jgi:dTDP-4-dehydrorhamnose reductase
LNQRLQILVTGANGQLGNECRVLSVHHPEADFVFTDMEQLSIADEKAVQQFFSSFHFDYCINAAAYTAVDQAESDESTARLVNATAVGFLAKACAEKGCRLIHVSTDYVFDGTKATGNQPEDPTGPINVYGKTKLEGEQLALELAPESIIIRTSWVYSFFGKNFVKTMMRLMQEKEEINVVADQTGRPTYAADLATFIFDIIFNDDKTPAGIYHFANQGSITWYEFAVAIQEICGFGCRVNPIPSTAYPVPATRPRYSILQTDKSEQITGVNIPFWRDSLEHCIHLLRQNQTSQ